MSDDMLADEVQLEDGITREKVRNVLIEAVNLAWSQDGNDGKCTLTANFVGWIVQEDDRLRARVAKLEGALRGVLTDIADYERVNNFAPNPGKQDCWQSVTHARAILANAPACPAGGYTGQPSTEEPTVEACLKAGVCGCDVAEMLRQSRYYVRREQCWGETFVWVIADREGCIAYQARCVGKPYKTERAAKSMCEKANKDWERYQVE